MLRPGYAVVQWKPQLLWRFLATAVHRPCGLAQEATLCVETGGREQVLIPTVADT